MECFAAFWEDARGKTSKEKLVLPRKLRSAVLKQLHDGTSGGHFGVKKTLDKVRDKFYWIDCM